MLNICSLNDNLGRRLLIASSRFLMMVGGRLDLRCTYTAVLLGSEHGACLPVFRSKVTSKKCTTFRLASVVMCRRCWLNMLCRSFLITSTCLGVASVVSRQSSLYRPKPVSCLVVIWWRMNEPTNSQVSAPSKLPIVTSNRLLVSWPQAFSNANNMDSLVYNVKFLSAVDMYAYLEPKSNAELSCYGRVKLYSIKCYESYDLCFYCAMTLPNILHIIHISAHPSAMTVNNLLAYQIKSVQFMKFMSTTLY